jgi:S1-C subfamily serine protease
MRRSRLRFGLLGLVLCLGPLAGATAASAAGDADIVTCYDPDRSLVTHTLTGLCGGEVISAAREAELVAARRLQIESSVLGRGTDPITGARRLLGSASGFYIGRRGELLTNYHVVSYCGLLTATPDGGAKIALQLIATDPEHDLALLRADAPPNGIAAFSSAPARSDGARLAVVGYPAYGLQTRFSILAPARIDPMRLGTTSDRVEFAGEVRHGNSGSPLLDDAGNVLGIVHSTIDTPKVYRVTGTRVTDIGVAISWTAIMRFLARHSVEPVLASGDERALTPDELHAKSRSFVAQIGCWR